ncbi:MAG: efflux RND transporter periplasmic adaptor subunit [Vicinamibacteria bacterium]|nr:efflux RND transporter periplasmic adaptor subunit [Vicinamibacteria bacterium]
MNQRTLRRLRLGALALAALALGVALGLPRASAQAPPVTSPPAKGLPRDVRELAAAVDKAAEDAAALSARYSGEFVSAQRSELTSRIAGRVKNVMVDEGSLVGNGAPLLELETEYLDLEVRQAAAEVARSQAALNEAQRDAQRKAELVAKGSVSEAASFRSSSVFAQAQAQLEAASVRLSLAETRRGDALLRAPFGGVVERRMVNSGERLAEMTPAFVIVQMAPLKLRFRVRETDLTLVRKGQGVEAEVEAYPGVKFRGVISVAGGAIDPATRTFLAEARFDNRDLKLRPGLFARVRVLTGK